MGKQTLESVMHLRLNLAPIGLRIGDKRPIPAVCSLRMKSRKKAKSGNGYGAGSRWRKADLKGSVRFPEKPRVRDDPGRFQRLSLTPKAARILTGNRCERCIWDKSRVDHLAARILGE